MSPRRIRSIAFLFLLATLLVISLLLFANHLIQKPSFQKALLDRLSNATGADISSGRIELTLWKGVGLWVDDFKLGSRTGDETLTASRVRIVFDGTELLKGRIEPRLIYLKRPRVTDTALYGSSGGPSTSSQRGVPPWGFS